VRGIVCRRRRFLDASPPHSKTLQAATRAVSPESPGRAGSTNPQPGSSGPKARPRPSRKGSVWQRHGRTRRTHGNSNCSAPAEPRQHRGSSPDSRDRRSGSSSRRRRSAANSGSNDEGDNQTGLGSSHRSEARHGERGGAGDGADRLESTTNAKGWNGRDRVPARGVPCEASFEATRETAAPTALRTTVTGGITVAPVPAASRHVGASGDDDPVVTRARLLFARHLSGRSAQTNAPPAASSGGSGPSGVTPSPLEAGVCTIVSGTTIGVPVAGLASPISAQRSPDPTSTPLATAPVSARARQHLEAAMCNERVENSAAADAGSLVAAVERALDDAARAMVESQGMAARHLRARKHVCSRRTASFDGFLMGLVVSFCFVVSHAYSPPPSLVRAAYQLCGAAPECQAAQGRSAHVWAR